MHISVITPVYNAAGFVEKAVNSALQLDCVKEVILIEDGSSDNSLEVCKKIEKQHERVKLFQHLDKKNYGAGASRNVGLKNATCSYIAFLDADDYYLPNRFDIDKEVLENNNEAEGVYNAIGVNFYSDKASVYYSKYIKNNLTTMVYNNVDPEDLFAHTTGFYNLIGHFSLDGLTIKKSTINKHNLKFNENLPLHQDTDFIIRLSYYGKLIGGEVSKPVAMRGIHDNNRFTETIKNKKIARINRLNLWEELSGWAIKNKIEKKYVKHFSRMKKSKKTVTLSYVEGWLFFIFNVFFDKNFLLKSIYYDDIHKFLFGENRISHFMLRAKYKIQIESGIKLEYETKYYSK